MIHQLIHWALYNPLIVAIVAVSLAIGGSYAFFNVNVEAYPDPAPAIIEVVAQYPGASAEEVERQVTVPLEVALAGMPGLQYTRTKSLAGLSHMRNQFEYGVDYYKARQEIINRLSSVQGLPQGVVPNISPMTPTGELVRYSISTPKDEVGRPLQIYSLNHLKEMQDWSLERIFKRIPRIADVSSYGGTVKRYEVHADPERLRRYGITLQQLQNVIANSNANIGADYLVQGGTFSNVRSIGLLGGGLDPMVQEELLKIEPEERKKLEKDQAMPATEKNRLVGLRSARRAALYLQDQEDLRLTELRNLVVTTINNVPVRVEDLIEGGPLPLSSEAVSYQGVIVGHQSRLGKVSISRPRTTFDGTPIVNAKGEPIWDDEEDKVQGIVLMRKNEDTLPALLAVKEKIKDLNDHPGQLLPGTSLQTHFDLTGLIHVTTETVRENLLVGMCLVTVVLLMFLSNVRSALIVAINIPLALLFAFSIMFLRGKSANLLSIGAVDFGIIVDSSVIMVENIYRHISAGEHSDLPLRERILRACLEVERGLFFSTVIMVCAFIPLFTMQGPEGQIFGPMADTYAFALGGALILALTVSPMLCLLFFRGLKPSHDNFLVRWLRSSYLRQLEFCLKYRTIVISVFAVLAVGTFVITFFRLDREFMPELEEGNLYIRGTFPVNASLNEVAGKVRISRSIMRKYPEVLLVASQVGRPDDGTDPSGFYNAEFHVPLRPEKDWPKEVEETGWRRWVFGAKRARTKAELTDAMRDELNRNILGVDWGFSQYIRDNVTECLSGVKGDNSIKIFGPSLDELERLANEVKNRLEERGPDGQPKLKGVTDIGIFRIKGQSNLELGVDREKCRLWGISVADVQNAIKTAVGGQAFTQMTEGEKTFDVTIRWPERLRVDLDQILDIPVDVGNNTMTQGGAPALASSPVAGAATGPTSTGTANTPPSLLGSQSAGTINNISASPRRRLRDLVSPVNDNNQTVTPETDPDHRFGFYRPGASTIAREQGQRFIAIKFSVAKDRGLAGAVAEAKAAIADLIPASYRTEWSGEFQEMEEAERRLMIVIPLSLALIFLLLYLAFRSFLDVLVVLSNVVALSLGGFWALMLTGTHFSISAAVGFISIFGVAIMDGLLSISYFNALRAKDTPLREAILEGAGKRVRPMMMTALTAIFGLLPAAVSTRIGSQTQQPLAIVVVGGMTMTLLMNRYLMPVLYSFYGHREPVHGASGMVHE
jgi:cobalt-zinc-cadmium resistance protein CzcA